MDIDILVGDTCFFFESLHHGIVQVPHGGEVPVHRALAYPGAFGHGSVGESLPVPAGELVDEVGSSRDDALPGFGRLLLSYRGVVTAARWSVALLSPLTYRP